MPKSTLRMDMLATQTFAPAAVGLPQLIRSPGRARTISAKSATHGMRQEEAPAYIRPGLLFRPQRLRQRNYLQKSASNRMMGSGMPIIQSSAPLPKPIFASCDRFVSLTPIGNSGSQTHEGPANRCRGSPSCGASCTWRTHAPAAPCAVPSGERSACALVRRARERAFPTTHRRGPRPWSTRSPALASICPQEPRTVKAFLNPTLLIIFDCN